MGLFVRIARYGVVGTVLTVVYSIAIVAFVSGLHLPSPTLASILAYAVMLPLAYLAHRYVTFRDAAADPSQPWRFAVTTTAGFVVSTGGMYWLNAVLGYSYYYGIGLTWALIPAANFAIYLVWVFRPGRPHPATTIPAAAAFRAPAEAAEVER
jgi:putative flippase GtrA